MCVRLNTINNYILSTSCVLHNLYALRKTTYNIKADVKKLS